MYSLDKYHLKVCVDLPNGLYRFTDTSATGKTYLAKTLNTYQGYGEPVGSYSYIDFRRGAGLVEYAKGCKLFVVDRYDMYYGHMLEELKTLSKGCIILVDAKGVGELRYVEPCSVIVKETGFQVV